MGKKRKKPVFSSQIKIFGKSISPNKPVFIIAEAGLAHFGDRAKAYRLIDMASAARADAVKFQIFKTDELVAKNSPSWRKRLAAKELSFSDFVKIKEYCHKKNIIFLATAHDRPSLNFLDQLQVPAYKIGSGEVTNWDFIAEVASRKKPVLLSTGMYRFSDIARALETIRRAGNHQVVVLHCVTQYPVPPREVNLNAICSIRKKFSVLTGYSDHTEGCHFPIAAVGMGACVIEKHITLDFHVAGAQDWKVSCGPKDLGLMVQAIHQVKQGLGTGTKRLTAGEYKSLQWARKSLVALRTIRKDEKLSRANLCCRRPGTGIAPEKLQSFIGKKAKVTISQGRLIKADFLQ